jgi:hypothetical protein
LGCPAIEIVAPQKNVRVALPNPAMATATNKAREKEGFKFEKKQ